MSLWLWRGAIERAVTGEIDGAGEGKLRLHLATCTACRNHYDTLAAAARALAGSAAATRTEEARELGRLMVALDSPAIPAAAASASSPSSRRWRWSLALLPAAAALALWLAPRAPIEPTVAWRGATGDADDEAATHAQLLIYAAPRLDGGTAGPVRLAADFPGSGEASVPLGTFVQFSYRHDLRHSYVLVVGWDGRYLRQYVPTAGTFGQLYQPTSEPRSLGPSVDLSADHAPGTLTVWAVFSDSPIDPNLAEGAIRRGGPGDLPGTVVRGVLRISP